jgi:hypothetical protein
MNVATQLPKHLDQAVTTTCPQCSKQYVKSVSWLIVNDSYTCSCGAVISHNKEAMRVQLEKIIELDSHITKGF